jgi:NAD(P)-dependent dehydrogenase (short-subunit alcohol dehydrogenase family)
MCLSDTKLDGKIVVVTGGAGVIGRSMCSSLVSNGAKVAILDRTIENAKATAEQLRREGGVAIGVCGDVLDVESLKAAEQEISEKLGPCDILVNCAGGNHPKGTTGNEHHTEDIQKGLEEVSGFFDLDIEGFNFVFNLNFLGTLLPTQVFCKKMIDNGGGSVINISSMSAFCPLTKIPAYSAAKAAINNFTQWLAVHMSKVNVRVNAIAPGFFLSEQNRTLLKNPDGSFTERAEKIISQTPMGRFGDPEELVGTLLWLVDDNASGFVNGIIVPVDGGFSAYSGV